MTASQLKELKSLQWQAADPLRAKARKAPLILLSLFFFFTALPLHAQNEKPVFKQLTVEDGLSNNWVKAIIKDQSGFMWFGTFNGLNRYDGKTFKVFQVDEKNNLNDNLIESMMEDAHGNIWVGTFSGGLNRFDRKTETFTHFQHQPNVPSSISGNRINAIYQDKQGNLGWHQQRARFI